MLSKNVKILIAIIVIVVLPTAGALTWYFVTKDPTIRPLGITKRALMARTTDESGMLIIWIEYDPSEDQQASKALGNTIMFSLEAKGVVGVVKRHPMPGQDMSVAFVFGASTIGPFPASKASLGISAAVGAYRMVIPPEGLGG
ncbi:hypothetical protein SAMN04488030_2563 [Aliiroseovarius halocynthiae]|uniref:Uncharacterized protein n=1 Tax=Aliiroseovarius halocynthiae TaxID=985055 RepID=A0A545SQ07_9RHOB|nr:hypothetical protein [Aliiroseovarius halocynthiae]TQV67063.1 hypothetical protein FIL88_10765 [Aliiroseovarius halocynthiae]SMR82218.1 hypothetical protein SAMN04488030_2563 [Aliiroseovarius halocynthiae]